tara:strand:- start:427 stop:666 length:240 start_codon:yes stop_codon:yes gene_type:complete
MIDLSNQRVRDSFDAMLEAAAEVLSPQEMVQWHHRIENCENLSQAAEVTTQMIGRPMSDTERREADEERQSLILFGDQL